ncbi:MAG TPA: hypothetical protein VN788_10765 [Verrucomicrobiae bacterium]|nr:hypothetical protein [Verrucomicrobiae bacterium]
MRTFRPKSGPFAEQPFFEPNEIESICIEALQKVALLPSEPAPIRIDRFIEKRFGVQPGYEELPKGILGFTRFGTKGVEEIVVSKSFDDEGTVVAERRLRTTLAHEGGHGLLHAHLFAVDKRPGSLFGDGLAPDEPKLLCRDEGGSAGRPAPSRWWEFQANQAMGVLLLPKPLVVQALTPMLKTQGSLGLATLPTGQRGAAVRLVSDVFNVNPVVARIRIDGLYPPQGGAQMVL